MQQQSLIKQPVDSLQGIGRQSADKLKKLGINNVADLLFHLPVRYQDRTRITPLGELLPEQHLLVCGEIQLTDITSGRRRSLICRIEDQSGLLWLRFFHFSAKQHQQLQNGQLICCFGEIRQGYHGLEMIHPEYKLINCKENCPTESTLTPIYPLTEGIHQSTLRKAIQHALLLTEQNSEELHDWLPASLLKKKQLPPLLDSLKQLHHPDRSMSTELILTANNPALQRLAFEEFIAHHLSLQQNKQNVSTLQAPVVKYSAQLQQQFLQLLPFKPTSAQQRVMQEVADDCQKTKPMLRLIQGDVGSGKTVICAYTAFLAINCGLQVAFMAPTELLAEQHYGNFLNWFQEFPIQIQLLTAQTKGKTRQKLLSDLQTHNIHILIGTHALFQESVNFKQLGLVIIDEQHRFGVNQRKALREKGRQQQLIPHQLILTATPIPRTLAMLNYSELDISIIDELPPGRTPVVTRVIPSEKRQQVVDRINGWKAQGRQTYWVCTLIEESEALQCEAAEKTAAALSQQLPNLEIGLVHGRMKTQDKDAVMKDFKAHKMDLLVATTVIEVGVDVPNAGLMIIENPERLGLSQLHQLRGRVGRGPGDSYCLLMYQPPLSENARERLAILRETNDGFVIAEKDLQLRGPGEVMGTRQTGQMRFKIADLSRDAGLIADVKDAAENIQTNTPEAVSALIHRWIGENSDYADV